MKRRHGLSLMETTIAMALSTLLLAVALLLLMIGRSLFLAALEEASATRLSHLLPRQLVSCLEASSADCILAGESGFACLSAYDSQGEFHTGSDGRPEWQSQQTYYVPQGRQELRLHQEARTDDVPLTLHWKALLPGQGRLLATGVDRLQLFADKDSGRHQLVLQIQVIRGRKAFREEVNLWFTPLN